jgi:CubicO group peptidase (beta-lactamase class C family)
MARMIRLALVFSIGAVSAAAAQRAAAPLRDFDAYVARAVRDWNAPGLAVAVVKDDSVVFAKGYGVLELGKPTAVDAGTRFAIGSTTKAMTAAALGMLVDEGKVRWNDPVITHIPSLQLYDPVMTRELTVRDLLTHHTGLQGTDFLWYARDWSADEIFRRLRYVKPVASFRSRYAYQNVQYALAGAVIAVASGMSWEQFLRTRIWEPLGMTNTVATVAATKGLPNVASPHEEIDDTLRVIENMPVDPVAPAGSVWSSVTDMAKWMRFVLDSGRVGGRRLLQERTFRELLTPQIIVPQSDFYPRASLTKPHVVAYSLGWFLEDYAGRAVAMHTGSIDGMTAIIGLIPDQRLGVYVLANGDHVELRHALIFSVFDRYNGITGHDWSAEMKTLYDGLARQGREAVAARERARVANTTPSLALSRYAGVYGDSLYGEARVTEENGRLRVRHERTSAATLEHWNYDTFRARWDDRRLGRSFATFELDARGEPSRLVLELGTRMVLSRRPPQSASR